ncbi:MAG: serine hydrolase [Methanoregula sp.]|nr:serine hydrolase [Methanoregula sp.]
MSTVSPARIVSSLVVILLLWSVALPVSAAVGIAGTQNSTLATPIAKGSMDPAEVARFFDSAVPAGLAKYNVPGASVAVVKDGNIIFAKGYGYADIESRTPVNPNYTIFHIGSLSKLFVWTAVMQLVEEGKIDLDADVNTYLKDFKIPDTYPGKPVTMRNLMTHTAGFEDSFRHAIVRDESDLYPIREYCAENIPARVYPPGTVTSYSNYGATLAAVVVEDVSGMPFERYLDTKILQPLGMTRTSIRQPLPVNMAPPYLASGYEYTGMKNELTPDYIIENSPSGAISSTATDMARFLAAHMQNGTYGNVTILSAKTSDLMHARAFSNDPRFAGMCLGFYETFLNNQRIIGHAGDTKTFHSLVVIIPENNAGFFVSYNSIGGAAARDDLLINFMDHYYPVPEQVQKKPSPDLAQQYQKYRGTYETDRRPYRSFELYTAQLTQSEITISPSGTLLMKTPGKTVEYIPSGNGVFTSTDKTLHRDIAFSEDNSGQVQFLNTGNDPVTASERVPWYATTVFTDTVKNVALVVLATVIIWPAVWLFRRIYRIPVQEVPTGAVYARWTSGIAAIISILFILVILPVVFEYTPLISEYMTNRTTPLALILVLCIPVITGVLAAGAVIFTGLAWRRKYWNIGHRVHYTLVTIALLGMLWWVNFWNLVFWRL